MKNFKAFLLLPLTWMIAAEAHVKVPNLWVDAEAEKHWEDVTVLVPGLEGKISGVMTNGRKLRYDNFSGPFRAKGKLESSLWSGFFSSADKFKRDCHLIGGIIEREREKNHSFALSFPVVPHGSSFLTVVRQHGGQNELRGPDNKFEPIGFFKVDFETNGAAMVLATRLDLEAVKYKIMGQLNSRKESIARDGRVELDLSGLDDLACDMLNNRVKINVTINSIYSSAKLARTTLFSPTEIERIYADLAKRNAEMESGTDPKIMMPAYLSVSLKQNNREIDQLAGWEFQRLYTFLVDRSSGRPLSIPNSSWNEISSNMDRLSAENARSNSVYKVDIESGAQ